MRSFFAAGVLLILAFTGSAHAQSAISGAASQAGAAIVQSIIVPGGGAAGGGSVNNNVGTLSNPQMVVGQSTVGPSIMSSDACSRVRSGSIPFGFGAGWTQTDDDCARQRQAGFLKELGAVGVAYEHMCKIKEVADSDMRQGANLCSANRAKTTTGVTLVPAPVVAVAPAIRRADYPRGGEGTAQCLTDASTRGVPLSVCN